MKPVRAALAVLAAVLFVAPAGAQSSPELVSQIQKSLDKAGEREVSGPGSLIRAALDALARKKSNRVEGQMTVILGNFTYNDSGLGSPFSRFLEDQFSAALVKSKYFNLFPRDVLSNLPAGLQGAYQAKWGDQIQGSLNGKFFQDNGKLSVEYQLADLGQGKVILTDKLSIDASWVPAGLSVKPLPAPEAPSLPPVSSSGALTLSLLADRGTNGTYFDGEEMVLTVLASKDCWLKVYQIDGKGDVKLIFPNPYSGDGRLPAGVLVQIPGAGAAFAFKLSAPYGVETIRAVASTVPFQAREVAFESLGADAPRVLSRGMSVVAKAQVAEAAQAQVQYTVNPKN
jgi:hypothetical protein